MTTPEPAEAPDGADRADPTFEMLPFAELRDTGLLWLMNRVVFHPRGYALALHFTGDANNRGECIGWSLLGDGSEPWSMGDPTPEQQAQGARTEDELFRLVQALLGGAS